MIQVKYTPEVEEDQDDLVEPIVKCFDTLSDDDMEDLREILSQDDSATIDGESLEEFIGLSDDNEDIPLSILLEMMQDGIDHDEIRYAKVGWIKDIAKEIIEEYFDSTGEEIPNWIVIDHEATWDCNLRHDCSIYGEGGKTVVVRNT